MVQPMDDFELTVMRFTNGRAAFHPITGIDVMNAVYFTRRRMVDVAANDAVSIVFFGLGDECGFKVANITHRLFDFALEKRRKRPIGKAKFAAQDVEINIQPKRGFVGPIAKQGEPLGIAHNDIELIAVKDQIFPAIRGLMHRVANDFDAAKPAAAIGSQSVIMIAWNVDETCALSNEPEEFLQDVILRLRPM